MSDKSPDEAEKQTETGLKDTAGSEATIASPREQKTWHQCQEAHYIPEDESATHLALRPDQLNELKSQGLAEKFEIVGFEALGAEAAKGAKLFGPLENIIQEGQIKPDFVAKLKSGLSEIPESERIFLENAGVKIVAKEQVRGHGASQSIFEPDTKRAVIGMTGLDAGGEDSNGHTNVSWKISLDNRDVQGSLKHELGHALYHAMNLNKWFEFKSVVNSEKALLNDEDQYRLAHLLEDDSEMFAETYALLRGRNNSRTTLVDKRFPKTIELVKSFLATKMEQDK